MASSLSHRIGQVHCARIDGHDCIQVRDHSSCVALATSLGIQNPSTGDGPLK
jgi:hypothetical protein